MKYFFDIGDGNAEFRYDAKIELKRLLKELRRYDNQMSVEEYIDFMHEGCGKDDFTLEAMLILARILYDYGDIVDIDDDGIISIRLDL